MSFLLIGSLNLAAFTSADLINKHMAPVQSHPMYRTVQYSTENARSKEKIILVVSKIYFFVHDI
jgi:hypothetical protein